MNHPPIRTLFELSDARTKGLRLPEILAALSHALDITEGQPPGHSIRCCWLGMRIGTVLALPEAERDHLYYTLLLKDLGCSSNAARISALYLADDITFKRDYKVIDPSLNAALKFVFRHTGLKADLSERIRATVNILRNGGEISRELIETRCDRGADIAARMRFPEPVQQGIRCLDEHWNGGGKPAGLAGAAVPVASNIALLAQVVDVFHVEQGVEGALAEARSRSSTWFDPAIVEAFLEAAEDDDFWAALTDPDLDRRVLDLAPPGDFAVLDEDYLDDIAEAFADVVDAKSSYTAEHSRRVTLFVDMIAEELGLSRPHRRWLRRAALLHDIGKLGVSNEILDKPGKLDPAQWEEIRAHPKLGQAILERVDAFADLALVAGTHHERVDGRGYPYGLGAADLALETMILTTADVFDALTADRPYRAAMPVAQALETMDRETGTAFHPDCMAALRRALERMGQSDPDAPPLLSQPSSA